MESFSEPPNSTISTQDFGLEQTFSRSITYLHSLSGYQIVFGTILTALLLEHSIYWLKKFTAKPYALPGPNFFFPVLGCIVKMIQGPGEFWEQQRKYSFPGFSVNYLFGYFMIFSTDVETNRKILSQNSEDTLMMLVHPAAKDILGPTNLAFQHGPRHKALRKSFLSLFTKKALQTYVQLQDGIIRNNIKQWMSGDDFKQPIEVRPYFRDMNASTSQEVFAGPYLTCDIERKKFSDSFRAMTEAFLSFPLCIPYVTNVWKGKMGRLYILEVLRRAARESKQNMLQGNEPTCLLDFWSQTVLKESEENKQRGEAPPDYASDEKMADCVMDFLFASQDASTASLVWTVTQMAENPDVLEKVREEQLQVRGSPEATVTGEMLERLPYTRQVVKEILRYRPPAPMVPQKAMQPFPMKNGFVAPKGSLIIPSITASCMQGYQDPTRFDPDRFSMQRKEDIKYAQSFLTFGHGPHKCVGQEYAQNHLMAFLSIISLTLDWKRLTSSKSNDILYLPTVYPGDSVFEFKQIGQVTPNTQEIPAVAP